MGVGGKIAVGHHTKIGEIAAPAARDQDFRAGRAGVVDDQHPASAQARHAGRHQSRRACAKDDDVRRVGILHQ
jgi:hypothetical protein